jgi:integrase
MRSERKKDRYTLLPERLFTELRKYYREYLPRYWLFEGIDLRYIQELLGHASTKTAEVYTRVASNALIVNRKKKCSDLGKMNCSIFGNKSAVFLGTILQ